jgi:hypothetical protein
MNNINVTAKPMKLSNLSDFQEQCFDALNSVISKNNLIIKDCYTDGISETYLVVEILSNNNLFFKAYIYVDECMFSCDEIPYYFEKYDFDSTNELIASFVETILSIIKGINPTQKRTSRINLFRGKKI